VNGRFERYSVKDGLPSDWITEILEDDNGILWIATNNGLSKFNPGTATFRNYTIEDGLLSNQIGPGCRSKTGELIFSSDDGFIIFHPDSIKDNLDIPPVYITDFYLFNKPVPIGYDSLSGRSILSKSLIECEELELNYDDKVFSFEFAALDYHAPMKNKYAYRMEGFDKDWTYVDADYKLITYTNLDPGKYTFRVKGSNNDGYWNEAGASLKIIIHPPWWQTSWAYLFYLLMIGSTVYFTWKAQLKRIRTKNEFKMTKFEARKMHEVDEMKSRFFTNISHEFRTPLTLILGPATDILDSTNELKTRKNISLIRKNANRLLGLVNQLLDISKLESGNMKLQTAPQNIVTLLKAFTLSFTSYAERKRITLKFNSSENEIMVYLDKDKIEKIMTNLLSNAFKFTPEGGRIEISMRVRQSYDGQSNLNMPEATAPVSLAPPDRSSSVIRRTPSNDWFHEGVEVRISDSGIGIPPDKLPHIFDRFYQVDGSHTREQEGTGIGLALTKELVELHKGKIEVESVEGKGTTFVITLPLGKDHLKLEEIGQAEDGKEKDLIQHVYDDDLEKRGEPEVDLEIAEKESFPSLLIIEDNFDLRKYIKDQLQEGYRILEAGDGEDGWAQSLEHLPDLIISDVMMPKMDGFQLCQKLKMDERTSHIPVILLTAKAAKEDKLAGYETGADEYIMKPFEPVELRARIKNLLEQRNRLHEHFSRQGIFDLHQAKITPVDKIFLQKIYHEITLHISDPSFGVETLAENIAISRSVLHRKLVSLTGEPPVEFIRRIRLNRAVELMEKKFGNLSEIALEVGFTNPAYFSDCFRRQFGVSPSQYRRENTIH
jgi:signal transduction histidine kinase/DNA-binding response OmpR family regulator